MKRFSTRAAAVAASVGLCLAAVFPATAVAEDPAPSSQPSVSESATNKAEGIDVKGSVDEPVAVAPSRFGGLIPKFKIEGTDLSSNFGMAFLLPGDRSFVNEMAGDAKEWAPRDLMSYLSISEGFVRFTGFDDSHYVGLDFDTIQLAAALDKETSAALGAETNAITAKYKNDVKLDAFYYPAFPGDQRDIRTLIEKWDVVSRAVGEMNAVYQKYTKADLFILPSSLAEFVDHEGGYGLLISSADQNSTLLNATMAGTVITMAEEPSAPAGTDEGGFGGIGVLAILGAILAAIAGILMNLNLIPRFW